jgi:hypothetical protein
LSGRYGAIPYINDFLDRVIDGISEEKRWF